MRKLTFVMLLAALLVPFGFAQSESAQFGAVASVTIGRGLIPTADIHFGPDPVVITLRHCQDYRYKTGHWFFFNRHTRVDAAACAEDPSTVYSEQLTHNIVTDAGFDLISKAVSDTATQPAACNYIAVTNTAITPAAGDTTLSGEINNTNGLGRAIGTFAHSNGTKTYTVTKVFTATGTVASQATGLFNAASTGTLCYEATYTPVTVNSADTLTVTWTITLS